MWTQSERERERCEGCSTALEQEEGSSKKYDDSKSKPRRGRREKVVGFNFFFVFFLFELLERRYNCAPTFGEVAAAKFLSSSIQTLRTKQSRQGRKTITTKLTKERPFI